MSNFNLELPNQFKEKTLEMQTGLANICKEVNNAKDKFENLGTESNNGILKTLQKNVDSEGIKEKAQELLEIKAGKWVRLYRAIKPRAFALASQVVLFYVSIIAIIEFINSDGQYANFLKLFSAPVITDVQLVNFSTKCPKNYSDIQIATVPIIKDGCRCDKSLWQTDNCAIIYKNIGSPDLNSFTQRCANDLLQSYLPGDTLPDITEVPKPMPFNSSDSLFSQDTTPLLDTSDPIGAAAHGESYINPDNGFMNGENAASVTGNPFSAASPDSKSDASNTDPNHDSSHVMRYLLDNDNNSNLNI
jgi:hypothetical protein